MASCSSHRHLHYPRGSSHRRRRGGFTPPIPIRIRSFRWAFARLLVSPSDSAAETTSSWSPILKDSSHYDDNDDDGCGGWSVAHLQSERPRGNAAVPKFPIAAAGIGTSLAALVLASVSYLYFARKGFQFQYIPPLHYLCEILRKTESGQNPRGSNTVAVGGGDAELKSNSIATNNAPDQVEDKSLSEERRYKIIPVVADSTQLEALHILKKFNIIESDIQAHEICTRREYARWLVKANILLERNAKHKIAPSMLIAGSTITAFDDVSTGDPDFFFIQAIGEAGIVRSRLSGFVDKSCTSGEKYEFAPESFLSRIDLISWKALLDYPLNIGIEEKMLRKNVGFTDLGVITPDALQGLFMDALAGDKSIARRVFGNIRRLQPLKPVTKAQAAVALTSGRMTEAICIEIATIEAENITNLVNKKEIKFELIQKGEIQSYWEEKLCVERSLSSKIQHELSEILDKLEMEKLTHKRQMEYHVKEKAALDCQKHLLSGLKVEVDTLLQRLANEKAIVASEQQTLETLFIDMQKKQNATIEVKSILEAEKGALQILRSWVEDGAKQSQFRSRVLEDAVQRWKWDDQTRFSGYS